MSERLPQLTSPTLADQAYDALRDAIISGDLAPREKITERGLADRLAISPTPVREALRRLEQDHLIERLGPRAVQVTELDDGTAGEIRLVEGTLRALAARLAATNATEAQLAHIEQLLDDGDAALAELQDAKASGEPLMPTDLAPVLQLTREFHLALNEASNNLVLLRMLSLVDAFSLTQRLRKLDGELRVSRRRLRGRDPPLRRAPAHLRSGRRPATASGRSSCCSTHAGRDELVDR